MPGLPSHSRVSRHVSGASAPRLLRLLADAVGAVRWLADVPALTMRYIDARIERLTAFSAADWRAPGFLSAHVHPDDRDRLAILREASTSTGAFDIRLRLRGPHREEFVLRAVGRAVHGGHAPSPITGYFLLAPSVTSTAPVAEAALLAYPGALAVVHAGGDILATNASWRELAARARTRGATLDLGENYLSALRVAGDAGDAAATSTLASVLAVLQGEQEQVQLEDPWPLLRDDRSYALRAVHMREPKGAAIAYLDVSAQRRAELALLEARQELVHAANYIAAGELVGSLFHELRQPLTSLTMNLELIERAITQSPPHSLPQLPEALAAVGAALADQQRLRRTLQVSHDLVARHAPRHAPVDVGSLAKDLVALIGSEAMARHLTLEVEAAADLPLVEADVTQLRLAMLSLLMHRVESVPRGDPARRSMRVSLAPADDDMLDLSIAGPLGMPADEHATYSGGLALARAVAESHRGTLSTAQHPSQGLMVSMRIPIGHPATRDAHD